MRALVKHARKSGCIKLVSDRSIPEPAPHEVLIKIKTASICGTDLHIYLWDAAFIDQDINIPAEGLTIGHEFCGTIEKIGSAVGDYFDWFRSQSAWCGTSSDWQKPYKVGDFVTSEMHHFDPFSRQSRIGQEHLCPNTMSQGLKLNGAFAEYVTVPAWNVKPIGAGVFGANSAALPCQIGSFVDVIGNAVHALQLPTCGVDGARVLVIGAGPVGFLAGLMAHHMGAAEVHLSNYGNPRLERARELNEEFRPRNRQGEPLTSGNDIFTKTYLDNPQHAQSDSAELDEMENHDPEKFDIVVEAAGAKAAYLRAYNLVRPGGEIVFCSIGDAFPWNAGLADKDTREAAKNDFHHNAIEFDYTRHVVFKGIRMHGMIGRNISKTWDTMLRLMRRPILIEQLKRVVTSVCTFEDFEDKIERLHREEEMKVVIFPSEDVAEDGVEAFPLR